MGAPWENDPIVTPARTAPPANGGQPGLQLVVPPQPDAPPAQTPTQAQTEEERLRQLRQTDEEQRYTRVTQLRQEFDQRPDVRSFNQLRNSVRQLQRLGENESAQADIATIFMFMRSIEPGGIVREGEQEMARRTAGAMEIARTYLSQLESGRRLSPEQRRNMQRVAYDLYIPAAETYNEVAQRYGRLFQDLGEDPNRHLQIATGPETERQRREEALEGTDARPGVGGVVATTNFPDEPDLPPGAERFQAQLQAGINSGRFRSARDALNFVAEYNRVNGTNFTPNAQDLSTAIDYVRQGGHGVRVQVPRFHTDIADVRGENADPRIAMMEDAIMSGGGPANAVHQIGNAVFGRDATRSFERGVVDIPTLGQSEEVGAAIQTVFGDGTMAENLRRENAITNYDEENHPVARLLGQTFASLAIPSGVANSARTAGVRVLRAGGTRAEALAAVRTAAARRLSAEGAAFGGAYGFGSADGDLVDRITQGTISTLFGGAAGYGLGRAGGRLAARADRRSAARAPDPAQLEAAQAAEELGIDLPRFIAGGENAQAAGSRMEQTPFGGPVIRAARDALTDAGEGVRNAAAARVGTAAEPEAMGERAVSASADWRRGTSTEGRRLYTAAERAAGDADVVPTNTMQLLARLIREEREVPGGTDIQPLLERYANAFSSGGRITIRGARKMRTTLRTRLGETMTPDNADRLTNDIMGAVGRDIEASLRASGRDSAISAYRAADDFWRQRMSTINDVLRPIVGRDGENWGAQAARAIQNDARGNGARLGQFLNTIPADAANDIRASLISRLGRSGSGHQDAGGDQFSLETFLTNWDQIRGAREQIFDRETVAGLNRLAIVANRARVASRTRNTPNTGSIISAAFTSSPATAGIGATLATGDLTTAIGGVGLSLAMGLRQYAAARLLASPRFAQRLAATPTSLRGAESYWSRPWVANMARSEPAIAADILSFREALLGQIRSATSASQAGRAAAEENNDVRREPVEQ